MRHDAATTSVLVVNEIRLPTFLYPSGSTTLVFCVAVQFHDWLDRSIEENASCSRRSRTALRGNLYGVRGPPINESFSRFSLFALSLDFPFLSHNDEDSNQAVYCITWLFHWVDTPIHYIHTAVFSVLNRQQEHAFYLQSKYTIESQQKPAKSQGLEPAVKLFLVQCLFYNDNNILQCWCHTEGNARFRSTDHDTRWFH